MIQRSRRRKFPRRLNHTIQLATRPSSRDTRGGARIGTATVYATVAARVIHSTSRGNFDRTSGTYVEQPEAFTVTIAARSDVRRRDVVTGDGSVDNPLLSDTAEVVRIEGDTSDRFMKLHLSLLR